MTNDGSRRVLVTRRGLLAGAGGLIMLPAAAFSATQPGKPLDKTGESARTGCVRDARFDLVVFDSKHPEQPRRVQAIHAALNANGLLPNLAMLEPIADVEPLLRLAHTERHIAGIRSTYDDDTNTVARAAVGSAVAAVAAVAARRVRNAFVPSRPPGHHASNTGKEEGFCFFNNIAIAARYAQRKLGYNRILIVDWDYHHGNGTESLFFDDHSVFYFSTFDPDAYPRAGDAARTRNEYAINVPLRCGATDDDVLAVYRNKLVPIAERFKPDFVLVSAGFDSRVDDSLGCFKFTDSGYIQMTRIVAGIAARYCGGRLVSLLEGGYNVPGLASAASAHVAALLRIV